MKNSNKERRCNQLENLGEELKKMLSLLNEDSKARTSKQKPMDIEDELFSEIDTYDKLLSKLDKYREFNNYNDIEDYLVRRTYQTQCSIMLEIMLSQYEYIDRINIDDKGNKQDVEISFIKNNQLIKAIFDLKMSVLLGDTKKIINELFLNINNDRELSQKIFGELVENASIPDYEEGKIYFLIKSKSGTRWNELACRCHLEMFSAIVEKYFSDRNLMSSLIHEYTVKGRKIWAILIPVLID